MPQMVKATNEPVSAANPNLQLASNTFLTPMTTSTGEFSHPIPLSVPSSEFEMQCDSILLQPAPRAFVHPWVA